MKRHLKILLLILTAVFVTSLLQNTSMAASLKITSIKDLSATLNINQSGTLPKEVVATMSDKTTKKVAVTWDKKTVVTSKAGTFVFKGTVRGYAKQVLFTLKVVSPPSYSNPELARAVALGIGKYAKNAPITYKQFIQMLDVVITKANSAAMTQWKNKLPAARTSSKNMRRDEGMLAVFYAANALGADYNVTNYDSTEVSEKIGDSDWNKMSWNYSLFPGWDKPAKLGSDKWDNSMIAAYFYSRERASKYSGMTIFDFDPKSVSMRPEGQFTYEEALLAAVRLYDSGLKETEHVPAKEDKVILQNADTRRDAILNNKAAVKVMGTSYYISNSGNDNNDGRSPETAWATIGKVNSMKFNPGDGVFFERGGIYRGILQPHDNITFSAYGEGAKPKIYGSPENGANPEKWTLMDGTKNIWVFYKDMYDTGGIVFNDGKSWSTRKIAIWDGSKYVDVIDKKTPVDVKKLENLQFFSAPDYTGYSTNDAKLESDRKGKLYLRCDAGNPGLVYKSIEFLSNPNAWGLLQTGENCVVDNLCIMYGNQCGIILRSNSIAQNCEVAWVGGCIINFNGAWLGTDATAAIRAGDGIVLTNGSDSSAINNYIHHTYDSAITDELGNWFNDNERFAQNMTIKGNLAENCSGGILICDWEALQSNAENRLLFKNILIEDNYLMYSGYGWSHRTIEYDWGQVGEVNNGNCNFFFGFPAKSVSDIFVKNNVFYLSKYALVGGKDGASGQTQRYKITFSGNTYVQNTLGILAQYPPLDSYKYSKIYLFNLYAKKTVTDILGDKTGVVLMSQ